MTPFVAALRARPEEFRRQRSVAFTMLGLGIALACLAWLVWSVVDFPGVQRFLAYHGSRLRFQNLSPGVPYLSLGLALVGLVVGVRWGVTRNGPFVHVPTGSRMRRIGSYVYDGDRAQFDRFSAAFATADPHIFLPLPAPQARGGIVVELWAADADRIAWVQLGSIPLAGPAPALIPIEGDAYRDLIDAETRGALVAYDTSPLASAVPVEAGTKRDEYFGYDPAYAAQVLHRGLLLQALSGSVLVLGVLAVLWGLLDPRRLGFIILGGLLAFAAFWALVIARVGYTNSRNAFGRLTGTLVRITPGFLSIETLAGIAWSDILLIAVYDRRNRLSLLPLADRDRGTQASAQEFGRASGTGAVSISLVLRDGEAYRRRVIGAPAKGVVALGKRRADGPRHGWVLFTPDTLLPISSIEHLVQLLRQEAQARGIPLQVGVDPRAFRAAIAEARDGMTPSAA